MAGSERLRPVYNGMNYQTLANTETIKKTSDAIMERGVEAIVVDTPAEALEKIKSLIPAGASVMNGSSRTLEEIGFVEYLKSGTHGWNNLHEAIFKETDKEKQRMLRKQSVLSDFYLGSVHAIAETGEMLIASNSGSQLPHIVFTSPNIIFVAGVQKIVSTLADSMRRVEDYVYPMEDKRAKDIGYGGSQISKLLIFNKENPKMGRKVRIILVNQKLGF